MATPTRRQKLNLPPVRIVPIVCGVAILGINIFGLLPEAISQARTTSYTTTVVASDCRQNSPSQWTCAGTRIGSDGSRFRPTIEFRGGTAAPHGTFAEPDVKGDSRKLAGVILNLLLAAGFVAVGWYQLARARQRPAQLDGSEFAQAG